MLCCIGSFSNVTLAHLHLVLEQFEEGATNSTFLSAIFIIVRALREQEYAASAQEIATICFSHLLTRCCYLQMKRLAL